VYKFSILHDDEVVVKVNATKQDISDSKIHQDYMGTESAVTEPSEQTSHIEDNVQFQVPDDSSPIMRRDTFVGTPLYVSPEMLQESIALPASDLWALGCILFKMHTGRNAFNGVTEHQLF